MGDPLAIFGFLYVFGLILGLLNLLSVIWVIYDVITKQKKMSDGEKVIWVIVALFLGLIGAIIYYLVVKTSHKYEEEPEENIENPDEPVVF